MIKAIIINDNFFWEENLPQKTYRLFFEDSNGRRSIDEPLPYTQLEIRKGKIYCGKDMFFFVPYDAINSQFEFKYERYFDNFSTYLMQPNILLKDRIDQFNYANKLNVVKRRYNKDLLDVPVFALSELIGCSNLVLVCEYNFDYGANFIFFDSPIFYSKKYIKDIFENYGFNVVDKT